MTKGTLMVIKKKRGTTSREIVSKLKNMQKMNPEMGIEIGDILRNGSVSVRVNKGHRVKFVRDASKYLGIDMDDITVGVRLVVRSSLDIRGINRVINRVASKIGVEQCLYV